MGMTYVSWQNFENKFSKYNKFPLSYPGTFSGGLQKTRKINTVAPGRHVPTATRPTAGI